MNDAPNNGSIEQLSSFKFESPQTLMAMTPPGHLIRRLVPKGSILVFGPSGSAKSFFMLSTCFNAGAGRPEFLGFKIEKRFRSLCFIGEGQGMVGARCSATAQHMKANLETDFQTIIVRQPVDLVHDHAASVLEGAWADSGNPNVVAFDTYGQMIAGYSENDPQVASAVAGNLSEFRRRTGTTTVVLCHTPLATHERPRGAQQLYNEADCCIGISQDRVGEVYKMRDGEAGETFAFKLVPYLVGKDENDQEITSCGVERISYTPPKKKRRTTALRTNQRIVLSAVKAAQQDHGQPSPGFTGMPTNGPVTTVEAVERLAMAKLTQTKDKHKREAFDNALGSLVASEWLGKHNEYLWVME